MPEIKKTTDPKSSSGQISSTALKEADRARAKAKRLEQRAVRAKKKAQEAEKKAAEARKLADRGWELASDAVYKAAQVQKLQEKASEEQTERARQLQALKADIQASREERAAREKLQKEQLQGLSEQEKKGSAGVILQTSASLRPGTEPKPGTDQKAGTDLHGTGVQEAGRNVLPGPEPKKKADSGKKNILLAAAEKISEKNRKNQAEQAALEAAFPDVFQKKPKWYKNPRNIIILAAVAIAAILVISSLVSTAPDKKQPDQTAESTEEITEKNTEEQTVARLETLEEAQRGEEITVIPVVFFENEVRGDNGTFSLTVVSNMPKEDISGIQFRVMSKEDEKNIFWYDAVSEGDGIYRL